jgi:hypothetical protein
MGAKGTRLDGSPSQDAGSTPAASKLCVDCKEEKPLTDFYRCGEGGKARRLMCKTCFNEQQGNRLNKLISDYYGGFKCPECGFEGVPAQFDCHHMEPNSKFKAISKMRNYSEDKIIKELSKCQLLCANCHRIADIT